MKKLLYTVCLVMALAACSSIDCPLNNVVYAKYKLKGDVYKRQGISDSHQLLEIIKPWRLTSERLSRGIETGIYAHSMCLLEKFCNKLHLHQSLTTAHGDTTFIAPISAIAQSLFKQFVGCHMFAHSRLPRVWVMTILTSHRTSLHEHYEPYTRSIYRPKGLNTMNISYLHT